MPLLAAGYTTALQAVKALVDRLAAEHQLTYVIYRNGARIPVRAWAEAASLAKSAVAYNAGTLNRAREARVRYMEVFDGAGCGWTSHKDPDKPPARSAAWRRRQHGRSPTPAVDALLERAQTCKRKVRDVGPLLLVRLPRRVPPARQYRGATTFWRGRYDHDR
ncbi:hypothetical protein ACWEO4_40995 [Streptomyces sp. NPDC004393]|uniref:hypothetical protein n=1 Tax=Streptomyces sp. NPDC004533 TaxID=3154278 RepID=UPI0033A11691